MNFKIGFIQVLPGKSLEENLYTGKQEKSRETKTFCFGPLGEEIEFFQER